MLGRRPWNKGLKASAETRLKLSLAHKGQKAWNKGISTRPAVRAKQSAVAKGKRRSIATEFKQGGKSLFKGKKHKPRSRWLIKKHNAASRRVLCVETKAEYPSIVAASKATGIDRTSLRECCLTNRKHRRTGLSFKFADAS